MATRCEARCIPSCVTGFGRAKHDLFTLWPDEFLLLPVEVTAIFLMTHVFNAGMSKHMYVVPNYNGYFCCNKNIFPFVISLRNRLYRES